MSKGQEALKIRSLAGAEHERTALGLGLGDLEVAQVAVSRRQGGRPGKEPSSTMGDNNSGHG